MKSYQALTLALGLPKIAGSLLSVMLALVVGGCGSVATTRPLSATITASPAAPAATQRPVPTMAPPGSLAPTTPGPKGPASVTPAPTALETATPMPPASATSPQVAPQFAAL